MRRICWMLSASPRALLLACGVLPFAIPSVGCKSLNEAYLRMEVWKYERCFGHLPPGFVPTGAAAPMAGPAMQPCGQPAQFGGAPCGPTPCQGAPGGAIVSSGGCEGCSGAISEGGMPAGTIRSVPTGTPVPAPVAGAVTSSKPVVISDEVVLP